MTELTPDYLKTHITENLMYGRYTSELTDVLKSFSPLSPDKEKFPPRSSFLSIGFSKYLRRCVNLFIDQDDLSAFLAYPLLEVSLKLLNPDFQFDGNKGLVLANGGSINRVSDLFELYKATDGSDEPKKTLLELDTVWAKRYQALDKTNLHQDLKKISSMFQEIDRYRNILLHNATGANLGHAGTVILLTLIIYLHKNA